MTNIVLLSAAAHAVNENESFLLNKIINNLLTKMFFCAAVVLLFIIKLRFPKVKNIHHIIEKKELQKIMNGEMAPSK